MNTSSEPRRCPACSAEIPATAPQGLCPKCLLLGVASVAESSGLSEALDPVDLDLTNERRPVPVSARVRSSRAQANDPRQTAPSVEELAAAFPQLEVLELIGRGGMGFVYKARQPKLDRLVALKILPGHLASEPSFHERFEREARVLAKLQHPLIVSVYDFGEATTVVQSLRRLDAESQSDSATAERAVGWDQRRFAAPAHHDVSTRPDGGPALEASLSHPTNPPDARSYFYLMLEYVDGVNLREAMRAGRFTPDQALAIVPQVCEALQYAHSKGVLHRDIKPENILLDTDGRVKIADFGIAKVLGPEIESSSNLFASGGASESERAVSRLTATGAVLGTPLYMAPEQLLSPNAVDHRADIFSLGVVFYEMLTGELPMGRFAPPSEKSLANQQIDQRIDEVVLRALAKERELRQQSAGEMKTEVETISSTPRHNPGPPPVPYAAASPRQTPSSPSASGATGGSFEPLVRVKNTVEPVVPGWLLWDIGRVFIAMWVVSFLSVAIPLLLIVVTAPIWILNLAVFSVVAMSVENIFEPKSFAFHAGAFAGVAACVVIDIPLLYTIWRRWLRHFSPRRAGASLRWLFTPYSEEQAPSSGQTNSTASASGATGDRFGTPVSLKNTGERSPSPVAPGEQRPLPVAPNVSAIHGNTSGSGGWWALASLFIGTLLAMSPMVGFTVSQVDPANIPSPPSPAWIAFMVALMVVFMAGGTVIPNWLGWRHLIRQRRDHSRNGIIPALIAACFLPLLMLDAVLFMGVVKSLYPQAPPSGLVALCVVAFLFVIDGVILYSMSCWATYSPLNVPAVLKSARLWYPLGWTVLSALVAWGAFEAVQTYGRYTFMRFDTSVEQLEAKSGGYFVLGKVMSITQATGNRIEPTPNRADCEFFFIKQSNTERSESSVLVALPDLMIRRSRTVPNDVSLTEENLLAQMKLAGIDTNRLEVAAEARSLIETAHKMSAALVKRSQVPLVNLIDMSHWKLTTRPRFEEVIRHGWDVTHHTARGSLNIQVNQDDAFRAMAAVVAFWLVGLAILLGLLPTRGTLPRHESGMSSSESPWPRRTSRLVATLAGLSVAFTALAFLPLATRLIYSSPPAIYPPDEAHVAGTARVSDEKSHMVTAHSSHGDAAQPVTPPTPPQALSAAEAEAKRLGLIRVADASSGANISQQPIGLKGAGNEMFVEPHFSALVQLPEPTNRLAFTIQGTRDSRGTSTLPVSYPCDYIACDWTSGTDNPRIMGYIRPPGAYDFRADAETTKLLREMDSAKRAKVASHVLRLIVEANLKSAATESDWQLGTQAAHMRFKLVPKAISKLSVPEECLVVLTDDSRTVFTREGGRFTKHELAAAEPIRELRDGIGQAVSANLEADVKLLLDKAHRAVQQQNWEELLTCLTDDGRDEWIFEITTGSSLAIAMLEKQGGVAVLKAIPQMAILTQLGDELKKLLREPTNEEGKLLDQRYQNYSKLSAAERRQLRIDVMRANYPDMAQVATTTLTFVRQLDEKNLVIDFSAINDLHVEGDRATGTWSTADGKLNPIVIRRVEVNGKHVWKIDSLIGKSVMDPPFPVFPFPAGLMLEAGEPNDSDSPEDAPADASVPENVQDENVQDEEDSAES